MLLFLCFVFNACVKNCKPLEIPFPTRALFKIDNASSNMKTTINYIRLVLLKFVLFDLEYSNDCTWEREREREEEKGIWEHEMDSSLLIQIVAIWNVMCGVEYLVCHDVQYNS